MIGLLPTNLEPLTQEEIDTMTFRPHGLSDYDCRLLVAYMMGYMRMCPNIDAARQVFFQQIKHGQEVTK